MNKKNIKKNILSKKNHSSFWDRTAGHNVKKIKRQNEATKYRTNNERCRWTAHVFSCSSNARK